MDDDVGTVQRLGQVIARCDVTDDQCRRTADRADDITLDRLGAVDLRQQVVEHDNVMTICGQVKCHARPNETGSACD